MALNLLLVSVIIIACVICNKISNKIGTPMLLAFMLLGMFFGSDGLFKISFDNYIAAEQICSVALIFIMFYGGFGTKWSTAKPIVPQAIILSSLGTIMTAGLVGVFCHYVLHFSFSESFLIGSVISSTDAAAVFSILRSKRLNLRYNTASLLEIESGSNDPFSYMLTIIALSSFSSNASGWSFLSMLLSQVLIGIIFGFGTAIATLFFLKKVKLSSSGFSSIFLVAVAIISYAMPSLLGGNGYLSTYIAGIILGNCKLDNKQELVYFFDGTTGLMQMMLFFLLGLLSFPSQLPAVALTGLLIALFLTFVARPIVVCLILSPFKSSIQQQLLVAWSGMRGAASIVFAIMTVINPATTTHDIFHMVFFIVLFSILLQGTLLPYIAKLLNMTDPDADVMKTFNDYTDENPINFIQFTVPESHAWAGNKVMDIVVPPDSLFALLIRDNISIVPTGKTEILAGDTLILGGVSIDPVDANEAEGAYLYEKEIEPGDELIGKTLSEVNRTHRLVVLIKRGKNVIVPKGDTILMEYDILVVAIDNKIVVNG